MFNDVMNRKVHQAEICLLIDVHKVSAEMVDGRETIVVICLCEVLGKDRVALDGSRLVKPHEEGGVNLIHRRLEQLLQQVKAPAAAHIAATLAAMDARLRSRLRVVEQAAAPRRSLLKMQKFTLSVRHRPTNGAGSHVEADIVVARVVS